MFVKSPIFYMGNKFDLLDQIEPFFPCNIDTFYDIFGGSGTVSMNCEAKNVVYNELNTNIVELYKLFLKYSAQELNDYIQGCIKQFDLNKEGTDVRQNEPDIVEIREKYNKSYLNFRKAYNKSERDYRMLFALTFWSFSNLIRFNAKNDFNMPYGNRCYTSEHFVQMQQWEKKVKQKNIKVSNKDAFDILLNTDFKENDFIYLDPPYLNTTAIYNEKRAFGGWSIEDDKRLFSVLDSLDKKGIKWGMSNVYRNKGTHNSHLKEWAEANGYKVYHLNKKYAALGKGNAESDEVYITNNYDLPWGQLMMEV